MGRRAQGVLENARDEIAVHLQCKAREVLFTSGATEANNIALLGAARGLFKLQDKPVDLLSSAAEHPSVLGTLRLLQQEGHRLNLLRLDSHARVPTQELQANIGEHPQIIALQWANNETGAIQDLAEIVQRNHPESHFHCDAVQGFGKLPVAPEVFAAQTLVLSAHKFRGPKGIGILRVLDSAFLEPVHGGGGQQRGLRPGTESPAAAAACAHALRLALEEQEQFAERCKELKRIFLERIESSISNSVFNHPPVVDECLPNTINVSFSGIDGRSLVLACDAANLAVSTGSACASGAAQPSSVLIASGVALELARATLRISFSWEQRQEEADEAAQELVHIVRRLYRLANP